MTISSTSSKALGLGNGATTAFPYRFVIPDASSIRVTYTDSAGTQSVLNSAQYTVSGLGTAGGGTVTYPTSGSPIASGTSILIERVVPMTQPTSLLNQGGYFPEVVEAAFDRVVMLIQQLANGALNFALSLTFPAVDVNPTTVLPPAAARAGKYLAFDGNGNPIMAAGSALSGDVSAYTAIATNGQTARTIANRLNDFISVKDFGAKGDGVTDDTAAIQTAINSGLNLLFTAGTYLAHGLLQSTSGQRFLGIGNVKIVKNASGDLFTSSGPDVQLENIAFRGDSATPIYTGNNVVASGVNFALVNCGSRYAYGRAVKSTGGHTQIMGTNDIYQTADATSSGYDIELGVSGTATLYHQLEGIYSSQPTGGILMTDTGSTKIIGGQFGKLTIAAGTLPAGVNGGNIVGARILGAINANISNCLFTCCQFGAISITAGAATSGIVFDTTNIYQAGSTVINNGNGTNIVCRNVGAASYPRLQWGDDNANIYMEPRPTNDQFYFNHHVLIKNGKSFQVRNVANSADLNVGNVSGANDNTTLGHGVGAGFAIVSGGAGGTYLASSATSRVQCADTFMQPTTDNLYALGQAGNRWSVVYAGTGAINTSDERLKTDILPIDDNVLDAWAEVEFVSYRWKEAIESKGDEARVHFGVIAQRVQAAFEKHGLDPWRYGLLCRDRWEEHEVVDHVDPQTHEEHMRRVPAGERLSVRYEEALCLSVALMAREVARLKSANPPA